MKSSLGLTGKLLTGAFVALSLLSFGLKGRSQEASHSIADYVCYKLEDFTAKMRVKSFDEHEGEKINKDFGYIYKLKGDVTLNYKEANHLRVDGQVATLKVTMINNGAKQVIRLSNGSKFDSDLGDSPGKRKTLIDAGLISKGYLAYTTSEFKRMQVVQGINCAFFHVSYKDKSLDTSYRNIWIDPKTKVTIKREEFSQEGKLNCTYLYLEPKEVSSGIWFPTKITVVNKNGKEAGTTTYNNVKVNQGLSDSLFN